MTEQRSLGRQSEPTIPSMTILRRLIDNPVAFVGVLRALALFLAAQGVGWFSDDTNVDAAMNLISVLFPFISLLFTGASAKAADAEVRAALYTLPPEYAEQERPQ